MSIFIPKKNGKFYFIESYGSINFDYEDSEYAKYYIKSGNCYRTKEDAIRARDKQYAKRELEVLADELGIKEDFCYRDLGDDSIKFKIFNKFYIKYLYKNGVSFNKHCCSERLLGGVYSSNPEFPRIALERLGEAKLRMILEVE